MTRGNEEETRELMVIYRMRGLLGDATEDILERFDTKTDDTRQGKDEDEQNPDDISRLSVNINDSK